MFPYEFCEIFKNSFFYRTPLVPAYESLTKLAENNCEENHFSVEFFSKISQKLFISLSCNVSKNNSFTGFLQFLPFLNMSEAYLEPSQTSRWSLLRKQLTAPGVYSERRRTSKMELFVYIVNGLNSGRLHFFSQKASSQMFNSVLNTPLGLLTIFTINCILNL